jgi:N-acetylglutamate synthase-like GNAT family acetyltransferase
MFDRAVIRPCQPADIDTICEIINDAASAYKNVIPSDCWHEPYMSRQELQREIAQGVTFWAVAEGKHLVAVMGLQPVHDVALIRHAYTRSARQQRGHGAALLAHFRERTDRPMLVGTWSAATWAVRFYEKHGFHLVRPVDKDRLLRRYWTVSPRQIEESVVLADSRWFATKTNIGQ